MKPVVLTSIAMCIGLFYTLGSVLLFRRIAMDRLLDQALTALGSQPEPDDAPHRRRMTVGACLMLAQGVALIGLSQWSVLIFAAGVVLHAGLLQQRWQDRDVQAHRRAVRAYCLYVLLFAVVVYIHLQQIWWAWWPGGGWWSPVVELAVIASITAVVAWRSLGRQATSLTPASWDIDPPDSDADADADTDALADGAGLPDEQTTQVKRLRVAPEYACWPTWDHDRGEPIHPHALGLPASLAEALVDWDARLQATYNPQDPAGSGFGDDVAGERAWFEQGMKLAFELADCWDGEVVIQLSQLSGWLRDATAGLMPGENVPAEAIPGIAAACGIAEIDDLFIRMDDLVRQQAELPAWDGDTHDYLAGGLQTMACILVRVHLRYQQEVERGFAAARPEVRQWIELARQSAGDSQSAGGV